MMTPSRPAPLSALLPEGAPTALEHPLPAGMRDLLPEEAESRRSLSRRVLERFALAGYALVMPPAFEFADVLERGLGTLDPGDVLRFVEPESGEVAALRPDVTPQIARMIATRMRGLPPPYRLCYEGTVLRRRSGRARKHRQIPQAGVELAGVRGLDGDLELLAVAADAVGAAGLTRFTLDLGEAGIVRALLADAPHDVAARVSEAIARKDDVELADRARGLAHVEELKALLQMQGGRDAIVEGARLLAKTPAAGAVARLLELFDAVTARGVRRGSHGGSRRGTRLRVLHGAHLPRARPRPGRSDRSGGRYDELLERFGAPMAAVGFALDLDRLTWALRAAASPKLRPPASSSSAASAIRSWRASGPGTPAVAVEGREAAIAYARAWGFSHVVEDALWTDVATGAAARRP